MKKVKKCLSIILALWFSSTEMCYVPLSSSDYKYKLTIIQNTSPNPTKYAVAWSTDVMRAAPKSAPFSDLNGIYCIRNVANSKYLTLNSSATDDWQKAKLNAFSTTNSNNSSGNQKWIVNASNYGYNIKTGFGSIEDYVGISSVYNGSSLYSNVSSSLCCFNIEMNKDGTYSVFNSDKSRIMSYDSSRYIIWVPYLDDQDVSSKEKWTFEKVNFIPGDADANGIIDNSDVSYVQNILAHNITPTNIERYLSDADRNGTVNIFDANRILNLIDNTYIY